MTKKNNNKQIKNKNKKNILTICETFGNEKRNQMKYNCCCHVQESNIYEQKGMF